MKLEKLHDAFYVQRVQVSTRYIGESRLDVFRLYCEKKRVLHIGCAGYPLTTPETNLHVQLSPFCSVLDGYDIHNEMYSILAPFVRYGQFLQSLNEAKIREYDIVLIPEVLEHVGNQQTFLEEISDIKTKQVILTVPDLFQSLTRNFEYDTENAEFLEIVHPDHNCWYSPYTIVNMIRKYTDWEIQGIYWFNNISLLVTCQTRD